MSKEGLMMKMIGSDFDGTILHHKGKCIKGSTRELIQTYRDEGNLFVIVTGRSPSSFQKAIQTYDINFYDELICANGAVIYDRTGNCIYKQVMAPEIVKELLLKIQAMSMEVKYYINTETSSILFNDWIQTSHVEDVLSISLAFSSLTDAKRFTGFDQQNCACFLNGIYLDIMAKQVSKAAALLYLYQQRYCDELYCIGDGVNDIPMFQCTPHSYSFSYAEEETRTYAAHICDEFDDVMKQLI